MKSGSGYLVPKSLSAGEPEVPCILLQDSAPASWLSQNSDLLCVPVIVSFPCLSCLGSYIIPCSFFFNPAPKIVNSSFMKLSLKKSAWVCQLFPARTLTDTTFNIIDDMHFTSCPVIISCFSESLARMWTTLEQRPRLICHYYSMLSHTLFGKIKTLNIC